MDLRFRCQAQGGRHIDNAKKTQKFCNNFFYTNWTKYKYVLKYNHNNPVGELYIMDQFVVNIIHRPELSPEYAERALGKGANVQDESLQIFLFQNI